MDALLFIVAIAYVIFSAAGKNKKLREKAANEAARRRQATRAAESGGSPVVMDAPRPAAQAKSVESGRPAAKAKPVQKPAARVMPAPAPRTVAAPVAETVRPIETRTREAIGTQLTEISETKRHTLEASTFTGHAHEETSMSGLQEECPSDTSRRRVTLSSAPDGGPAVAAFDLRFDVDAVRKGFLYSEILAKPKALRRS